MSFISKTVLCRHGLYVAAQCCCCLPGAHALGVPRTSDVVGCTTSVPWVQNAGGECPAGGMCRKQRNSTERQYWCRQDELDKLVEASAVLFAWHKHNAWAMTVTVLGAEALAFQVHVFPPRSGGCVSDCNAAKMKDM